MTRARQEEERRPGAEPTVALAPLTPGQERFAAMMTNNPQAAFYLLPKKISPMPAEDPDRLGVKATRIGENRVEINMDLNIEEITFKIPIDNNNYTKFMNTCMEGGLEQDLIDALKKRELSDSRLEIIVYLDHGEIHVDAHFRYLDSLLNEYRTSGYTDVSPAVFAVLFDMLEPRGIGPDLEEIDEEVRARPLGEPASAEPAAVADRGPARSSNSWQDDLLAPRSRSSASADQAIPAPAAAPKTGEKPQARPSGGEAAPLTVEHLVALMRTDPKEVFAEIRRRIALKGSVGPANIGRTPAEVEIADDKLRLSFGIDYASLINFRKICSEANLSPQDIILEALRRALALGIRNGKYVLEIEASLDDSGVQINALSRDSGGLRRPQGEIQTVSREVFAELVGMLNPFDKFSTVRPRISAHRDDEGKRGHGFRALDLTEIRRKHK